MESKRACQVSILSIDLLIFINKNIRAEISEIDIRKLIEKINRTESWLFEKIFKISKSLARLTRKEGRKKSTPITNIRTKRRDIITDPMGVKRTAKEYNE